ncbi:Plasma serine protease inhibitor [Pseudolycoriella hygida]|uniref:Plasma serine protease inhibitor n=1 Tax=Pseudolycoriella hygida TaxID=35572 RepID=A0A9Q0N2Y6_9DIPT|nr:Plasma serine protease inhibitor [Pseudolycoriella hygida]
MLKVLFCLLLVTSLKLSHAHAHPNRHLLNVSQDNIVATATNIMTTNILKGNVDHTENYVFSPIGYTSILAILSEGAKGDTFRDISLMLKQSEERTQVRSAYRRFLQSLQGDNPAIAPQFKTWFYIYKNNSVAEEFKNSIRDNYFVEVKDIDRQNFYDAETDVIDKSDLTEPQPQQDEKVSDSIISSNKDSGNSKDIPDFETLKKTQPVPQDETRLIDDQVDSSKFDEVIEDRQYVEIPVTTEEIFKGEGTAKKVVEKQKENSEAEKSENLEIMSAEARYTRQREFGSSGKGEVASALSGNSIVGKKDNSRQPDKETESKMLLFNGLYYKGNWATPFQQLRSDADNVFYISDAEKIQVKMMRAQGNYKVADCKSLKAKAIDLPYDNERYSFTILLPNKRDGLKGMIENLSANTIPDIISEFEEESIDISIPKFSIDTTAGVEKNLVKNGLASIFTSKADLSGITTEQNLHIDELQQHVAIRVDEGSSSENFLTATNALRSNAQPEQSIVVDRPFLFFVRDVADDVIFMAGKNERYSFTILLPNKRDGLKGMIENLSANTIPDIISEFEEESIDISIPKFSIDTTAGVEKNLVKNGLASIFTSKADLSGITTEQNLHIDELQQHVAIRVDEGSSSENFLTATNALRSNAQPEQSIVVDRPFLFFVRDVADDVIFMAGKVTSLPTADEPVI